MKRTSLENELNRHKARCDLHPQKQIEAQIAEDKRLIEAIQLSLVTVKLNGYDLLTEKVSSLTIDAQIQRLETQAQIKKYEGRLFAHRAKLLADKHQLDILKSSGITPVTTPTKDGIDASPKPQEELIEPEDAGDFVMVEDEKQIEGLKSMVDNHLSDNTNRLLSICIHQILYTENFAHLAGQLNVQIYRGDLDNVPMTEPPVKLLFIIPTDDNSDVAFFQEELEAQHITVEKPEQVATVRQQIYDHLGNSDNNTILIIEVSKALFARFGSFDGLKGVQVHHGDTPPTECGLVQFVVKPNTTRQPEIIDQDNNIVYQFEQYNKAEPGVDLQKAEIRLQNAARDTLSAAYPGDKPGFDNGASLEIAYDGDLKGVIVSYAEDLTNPTKPYTVHRIIVDFQLGEFEIDRKEYKRAGAARNTAEKWAEL
ncbi:MAG: hypothetical protein VSS75_031250 [Candidatus Parabeggiatoa sp.]|nr:hypothetical protein [Candidatus Parabeggiatoa sp.]